MVGFDEVDGLVADLGGGSLELARVSKNQIFETTSLPLGVLRLENNPIITVSYTHLTLPTKA